MFIKHFNRVVIMYTMCSNIKNICILTHSEICVLHTSHKKCDFFSPLQQP